MCPVFVSAHPHNTGMTSSKRNLLFVFLMVAAFCVVASALAWRGYSQGGRRGRVAQPAANVVRQPSRMVPIGPGTPNDQTWTAAAQQNAQLREQLTWTFGGKEQHGWALYTPLLAHTLATEANADTSDFAQALARWQRGAGLPASGVLNGDTLYKLIATWQARRLKDRTYPRPDQLLTAPGADFYDPNRPDDQRQVEKETYAAYKRMVAAAVADRALGLAANSAGELKAGEQYLKLISAFRSRARQEQLRKESPGAGSAGLAVNSPHFTGRALDLYVGGDPVSTKDANRAMQTDTRVYRWLVRHAATFGFQPYFYEPWHWEYVGK